MASHGPEVFAINTNSKDSDKHPTPVGLTKDSEGNPLVMRILIDPCCTGTGPISARAAKRLGLPMKPTTHGGTFISVRGKCKPVGYTAISSLMLPTLSQDRTFSMDLEVVPGTGHMNYSIIMGQVTMHALKIDTKMSTHKIVWEDIHRPMVSRDYWSSNRMKCMTPVWKEYLKRLDAKKDSADDDSVNSGYTTNASDTSRPGLLPRNDDSTASTPSTRDSKSVSIADPFAEDLVQPNVALTKEDAIIGTELSFQRGIRLQTMSCIPFWYLRSINQPIWKNSCRTSATFCLCNRKGKY